MFVQVIQGRVADADGLRQEVERWVRDIAPSSVGWLGTTGGATQDGTAIAIVRFESAEAARRNSDRPEQTQWWMEASKMFAGEVTFHDCPEVTLFGQGGSNDAGFVQVIQGRYVDEQKARELFERMEEPMRELRPDVIGGEVCLHGDGGFTQVVYFSSEAEARAGERQSSPQTQEMMEAINATMTDVVYFDLPQPWLLSPR